MAFESLNDFLTMCYVTPMGFDRCHGGFVWTAYGIAAVVVLGNLFAVINQRKKVVNQIRRKIRREQASS